MSDGSRLSRKRKKTVNACQHCRQHKIKCSGQEPCQSCNSRRLPCIFEAKVKKVAISEQYLRQLESRVASSGNFPLPSAPLQKTTVDQRLDIIGPSMSSNSNEPIRTTRSLRLLGEDEPAYSRHVTGSTTITGVQRLHGDSRTSLEAQVPSPSDINIMGAEPLTADSQLAVGDNYRQLGHSSSWSFSRRVRDLIKEMGKGPELHDTIPIRDGTYGVPWSRPRVNLTNLDMFSQEYAEYLLGTISYSLGTMYYLFDKTEFLEKLREFYGKQDSGTYPATDPWLIQMLVIFALGKSINSREAGPSGPSGHNYFARAVAALPNMHYLYETPIISIEILCAFALFLQMMDMRLAAYGYIGDAVGMCLALGLNRKHDVGRISHAEFAHRSKLFWTVYVIDRKLSSLIGVPPKLHDEDIGISKPSMARDCVTIENAMAFHVELSSQLGEILNLVYGLGLQRQLGVKFVHTIQSILKRLSDVSKSLQDKMKLDFEISADHEVRTAASLHILHHLCTIITIRPVLFFVFESKIRNGHNGMLSDTSRHLFKLGAEAALSIQGIAYELSLHRLIDLLLPFDIDAIFASAFVLILLDIITPSGEAWDVGRTFRIMDDMARRGLAVVGPYKKDLMEVDNYRQSLHTPQDQQYSPPTTLEASSHRERDVTIEPTFATSSYPDSSQDCVFAAGGGRTQMQQDALQSALEFFNYMDTSAWIWDNQLEGTEPKD